MTFKTDGDDDPVAHLDFWNTLIIPKSAEIDGIPEDLLITDGLPPILHFKSVMQNLQKTIAIDHAKKVREGRETINMNGQLREKYSDYNYHFPDKVLNAGLSKKDFTAPFLIDVKAIDQDVGKVIDNIISDSKLEPQKRKEPGGGAASTTESQVASSPSLYAMLEQPTPKRIKIAPNAQINSNNSIQSKLKPSENQASIVKSLKPILPKPPSQVTTVQQSSAVVQNLVQPQHRQGLKSAAVTPSSRGKTTISILPKPSQPYVSIRPTLPVSVISPVTPQRVVIGQQQQQQQKQGVVIGVTPVPSSPRENGIIGATIPEKDADDDFFPKIINTQGSVVMAKGTAENNVQKNGRSQPPKLVQIQPKRTVGATVGEEGAVKILKDDRQNTTAEKREAVRGSSFLGCRHCGKTFPSNCDSLYRSHMIIKHSLEVPDAEILEAKIQVTSWYKCKKCSLMVLNNLEEHHKKCLPSLPFDHAFDPIQVLTDDVPKLGCGLCSEAVDSRVNLRAHLQSKHPHINHRVLLDPYFRCGICLLYFTESKKLIEHVKGCSAEVPTPETAQEIAQKNLFCEICNKKHAKIRETLFCYQVKSLLRCVLCMHVCQSRQNFFNHLKTYHDRRTVGLCCPFCNDHVEKPTRQAFDHFIDNHLNAALKRAGEAALVRGRLSISQNPQNNNNNKGNISLSGMPRLTKATVQGRHSMPIIKPKAIVPGTSQITASSVFASLRNASSSVQVPVSQVLQVTGSSQLNVPTQQLLVRPVIINRQMPLQISVVPATNIQATVATTPHLERSEPEPPAANTDEDSILGT